MKILFISTRNAKPSYRFRIEQHIPYLQERGHECKTVFVTGSLWSRMRTFQNLEKHDVIILQKKLLTQRELKILRKKTPKLIYDIDDAVMFNTKGNPQGRRQHRFQNTARIADEIICGNEYLAEQGRLYNRFVTVIPTAVNVKKMHQAIASNESTPSGSKGLSAEQSSNQFTIGWTGSKSNASHLNQLFPILSELGDPFHLKIISDSKEHFQFDQLSPVTYEFISWTPENEFRELATMNAGLMPLPDNNWTRGKCSFKALQYMAMGIPTICSPVGMNEDLIDHGKNGFLARSDNDWKTILLDLQKSSESCTETGREGQQAVLNEYDTEVISLKLAQMIEQPAFRYSKSA
jgi:glycosyltransferase involved in cell wall biosynthesis